MSVESPPSQTVLVAGRSGSGGHGSSGVLHIPDATGEEPLCACHRPRPGPWWSKDVAVYPPAWRDWCKRCLKRLEEQEASA